MKYIRNQGKSCEKCAEPAYSKLLCRSHYNAMAARKKYSNGIYKTWSDMKQRCNNPKHTRYHRYGGRGISYDPRWELFDNFVRDIGGTYKPGLSLDRIDNNSNYIKSNCRWADAKTQANNRRTNRVIKHKGLALTLAQWADKTGIKRSTIQQRIDAYGWSISKALTT